MFLLKVDCTGTLMDATSILSQVAKRADLRCSPDLFSLTATHHSARFTAALRLTPQFFASFSFYQNHHSRIFIDAFFNIMFNMEFCSYSSMKFGISQAGSRTAALLFESSRHRGVLASGLVLLPSAEEGNVGEIDYRSFFSIDSREFRRIITELSVYYDSIRVTVTDSQVKFSVAAEEIVLSKEEGQCVIGRIGAVVETQFLITLHPRLFFLELTNRSRRIWFFKSIDSCPIIAVPIALYAQFWVYYPQR